jgi:hypothetical protein
VKVTDPTCLKAKCYDVNVPFGVLTGLRKAFIGELTASETRDWLGTRPAEFYKFVCLTEPDMVLQTRPGALASIRQQLDQGRIVIPHRLQTVPHIRDVKQGSMGSYYLESTGNLSTALELGPKDSCCDTAYPGGPPKFGIDYPGGPPAFAYCGDFWYICGFYLLNKSIPQDKRHERLLLYGLITLNNGMDIVSLAASEHGRSCRPQKSGIPCTQP